MLKSQKCMHLFEIDIFCNIINVCTVTFKQINASLWNSSITFFQEKNLIGPKHLNSSLLKGTAAKIASAALRVKERVQTVM